MDGEPKKKQKSPEDVLVDVPHRKYTCSLCRYSPDPMLEISLLAREVRETHRGVKIVYSCPYCHGKVQMVDVEEQNV